jgi:Mn2+/Fe2+ NRAMP family transporter
MWSGRYQQVGIPLVWGVALIGAEVFLLLSLQARSCWLLEALAPRILVIGACFAIELTLSKPEPYPLQAVSGSDKRISQILGDIPAASWSTSASRMPTSGR